jgi:hypothetical protein
MHFFGTIGLALMAVGIVAFVGSCVRTLLSDSYWLGMGFWLGILTILFGLQWLAAGLLAEARLAIGPGQDPHYSVIETVGPER